MITKHFNKQSMILAALELLFGILAGFLATYAIASLLEGYSNYGVIIWDEILFAVVSGGLFLFVRKKRKTLRNKHTDKPK